jgi:hypothetical protein
MELIKDPDRNRARLAMEAMTKMIKINIAEAEHAADGQRRNRRVKLESRNVQRSLRPSVGL